ncbi:ribosomal RNA-processing protein 7 homolog A [Microcaecilia unicolor]|uniref:Ribosomal RNA-processing protein 7 homolog A n=1 Tax=Microcaecilia unicolor TaxID=1415580 RepID=A0A6P7YIM6_9AMPH|nr:ribosomal RNA-processing protein 7 homolog A [Microcaecilia unicolor]
MAASSGQHTKEEGIIAAPAGYSAIPIKFSKKSRSHHFLYVKEHRVREELDPTRPQDRTLFILNVPPYCTKKCLSELFSRHCAIESVELQEKPGPAQKAEITRAQSKFFSQKTVPGFRVAYVVFKSQEGAQAIKSLKPREPLVISTKTRCIKTGIAKWIHDYSTTLIDPGELQTEVDAFMQEHDKRIAEEEAKAEEEEGVPDEEGWVKVTRKGRRPGIPRTEAANLRALEREKKRRARKELLNFYAWQHRESKREHIAQLRKKFEEDKQKITLMRAQRKFRPY